MSNNVYTTFDHPFATPGTTQAFGLNGTDQIVGEYTTNGVTHGFLLSGGMYTTIDDGVLN